MTPFKFRLQSVLDHRQRVEDDLKVELAALETERAAALDRLAALDLERERVRSAIRAGMLGQVDVDAVARGLHHSDSLDARRRVLAGTIAGLAHQIDAKRKEVVEAMRERKALENLRDTDRARHEAARLQAEQKALDEIGTTRHHRRAVGVAQHGERVATVPRAVGADAEP